MNELLVTGGLTATGLYMGSSTKDPVAKTAGYGIAVLGAYLIWSRWQGKYGKQWFMNKRDGIIE